MWWLSSAWAFGIAMSPPVITIDAAPGSVAGHRLTVTNTSAHPVEVRSYMNDLWYSEEGKHQFMAVGTHERSAAVFARLEPSSFRLAPEEKREIELNLVVPKDARGGYYATAFFETAAVGGAGMRMGSLVLVDAGGVDAPSIAVSETRVEVAQSVPTVTAVVSQSGSTHSFCRVKGVSRREEGGTVSRVDGPEMRFLPGQKRAVPVVFVDAMEPGLYAFDGVVACDNAAPVSIATRFAVP